ncbi:MAG: rRNA pseudouridine synthase [Clostridiales Family XIII bacterium]|jgi:23S rRNA pseudouridine2605 synthase|nr:rRNA pseudouridine synthase [Clostridiales Family XIII bacterium]
MRINKYIAVCGIASRRKADEIVKRGDIKVDGLRITELGFDVPDGSTVTYQGRIIKPEGRKVYVALNKPKGFITTTQDEKDRLTVLDLVKDIDERVFPVGRLDEDTSGLLILTNDGEFANKLMHPKNHVQKTYRAKVLGDFTRKREALLRKGVDIGGYITKPAEVNLIKQAPKYSIVEIKISEGKNRQVRKMFSAVGNKVMELERTAIGDVYLGGLKQGHYRKLTRQEIDRLQGEN